MYLYRIQHEAFEILILKRRHLFLMLCHILRSTAQIYNIKNYTKLESTSIYEIHKLKLQSKAKIIHNLLGIYTLDIRSQQLASYLIGFSVYFR